jgi:hypothetical protein
LFGATERLRENGNIGAGHVDCRQKLKEAAIVANSVLFTAT